MTENKGIRRVGDVVPSVGELEGDLLYVRGLVGAEFVITGIQEREGEHGQYLAVQIELDGIPAFFFTSHQAIYAKLLKCQDDLPLLATITEERGAKSGRVYFDIH